ncbi:MAG: hypothetical protein NDJ72_11680 [Elusimicrobia bacterium]|nr:hypothetical protein [Elusimicrobiota bacterium]
MNTKMRTLKAALLSAALALLAPTAAHADANPGNDSGSFTIRITPNVDLGVVVDTTGANWAGTSANLEDLTSNLGTDTRLDAPISIAMAGNLNNQELTLTGVALNTWQLDTDEVDVQDQLRLYALFGVAPVVSGSPSVASFDGTANLITTSAKRAGQVQADEGGDTNHTFELPSGGGGEYADVDGMLSTATRKLWLRARTPTYSSTDGQAAFTGTVTAVTGIGF